MQVFTEVKKGITKVLTLQPAIFWTEGFTVCASAVRLQHAKMGCLTQ